MQWFELMREANTKHGRRMISAKEQMEEFEKAGFVNIEHKVIKVSLIYLQYTYP